MPSQDITNTVTACPIEPRIRELERAVTFARGAAVVVTAVLSLTSGAVGAGAMATRDASLAHGARLTALESGASSNEAARSRREEFDRTLKVLRAKGLTAEVIGQTPTSVPAGKWLVVALTRWQEIQAWLEAHPEVIQYAVLDDDAEGTPEDVYVYTKFSEGITDAHVERAVDLLTTDPNDCGCSMCCGTHVVVNCMGHQRPCDYCDCDIT